HLRRGARHRQLLRDVQAAPGRALLRQRVHQHLVSAARRRGAARARRGDPRHPRRRHHRGRCDHPRGRRVHRRVHRGARHPGQLPLLPQRDRGRPRPDHRRGPRRHAVGPGARPRHARQGPPGRVRRRARQRDAARAADHPSLDRPPPGRGRGERVMEPRVSSRFEVVDGHTLAGYQDSGSYRGYDGIKAALAMPPDAVTGMVKAATVLGRGGAGFPAGVKWGFCPPGVWPRYIVVNGDESEPGTYKDRVLMERDPHQLIEGCLIAAYAIGAAQVFLYVRGEMPHAQERIAAALNEAYAANLVGRNILGTDFSVDIILTWGAGAYIVGEETALIESLEGNRGMRRLKPPFFPAAKGLYMAPTIVNNVETLSNLPWLFTHSVEEYRAVGTEASPGTRLIALSGHVKNPGVFEVPQGTTTFRELF